MHCNIARFKVFCMSVWPIINNPGILAEDIFVAEDTLEQRPVLVNYGYELKPE